jgi:RNA recognition motif-containing protein
MAKLFVGSLAFNVTDDSLLQLFTAKGYSPISARVVTDKFSGQSRGFGFVELGQADDMARAIGELDGLHFEGRPINVSEARPREFRDGGRSGGGGERGFSGGRSGHGHRRY